MIVVNVNVDVVKEINFIQVSLSRLRHRHRKFFLTFNSPLSNFHSFPLIINDYDCVYICCWCDCVSQLVRNTTVRDYNSTLTKFACIIEIYWIMRHFKVNCSTVLKNDFSTLYTPRSNDMFGSVIIHVLS
jgi:hypothetical protein